TLGRLVVRPPGGRVDAGEVGALGRRAPPPADVVPVPGERRLTHLHALRCVRAPDAPGRPGTAVAAGGGPRAAPRHGPSGSPRPAPGSSAGWSRGPPPR